MFTYIVLSGCILLAVTVSMSETCQELEKCYSDSGLTIPTGQDVSYQIDFFCRNKDQLEKCYEGFNGCATFRVFLYDLFPRKSDAKARMEVLCSHVSEYKKAVNCLIHVRNSMSEDVYIRENVPESEEVATPIANCSSIDRRIKNSPQYKARVSCAADAMILMNDNGISVPCLDTYRSLSSSSSGISGIPSMSETCQELEKCYSDSGLIIPTGQDVSNQINFFCQNTDQFEKCYEGFKGCATLQVFPYALIPRKSDAKAQLEDLCSLVNGSTPFINIQYTQNTETCQELEKCYSDSGLTIPTGQDVSNQINFFCQNTDQFEKCYEGFKGCATLQVFPYALIPRKSDAKAQLEDMCSLVSGGIPSINRQHTQNTETCQELEKCYSDSGLTIPTGQDVSNQINFFCQNTDQFEKCYEGFKGCATLQVFPYALIPRKSDAKAQLEDMCSLVSGGIPSINRQHTQNTETCQELEKCYSDSGLTIPTGQDVSNQIDFFCQNTDQIEKCYDGFKGCATFQVFPYALFTRKSDAKAQMEDWCSHASGGIPSMSETCQELGKCYSDSGLTIPTGQDVSNQIDFFCQNTDQFENCYDGFKGCATFRVFLYALFPRKSEAKARMEVLCSHASEYKKAVNCLFDVGNSEVADMLENVPESEDIATLIANCPLIDRLIKSNPLIKDGLSCAADAMTLMNDNGISVPCLDTYRSLSSSSSGIKSHACSIILLTGWFITFIIKFL